MTDNSDRLEGILRIAGLTRQAWAGNRRYAQSEDVRPGIRYSCAHVRGRDEFGLDFRTPAAVRRAEELHETLRLFGLEQRDITPREDLHAYRWTFPPRSDGSIDAATVRAAKRVADAILAST